ncbi:hypothetical protein [Dyella sp. Tek66A03]|uniref:hypothetical protein n=1 Tax=Dyella sp. Tek66A03 TaxID=3458298 RepID=UPI00403E5366
MSVLSCGGRSTSTPGDNAVEAINAETLTAMQSVRDKQATYAKDHAKTPAKGAKAVVGS